MTYIRQGNEWKTKRFQAIMYVLIVVNHSMCGQINPSKLLTLKDRIVLTRELHYHIVAEQENAVN
jgi:hypothetical protein